MPLLEKKYLNAKKNQLNMEILSENDIKIFTAICLYS